MGPKELPFRHELPCIAGTGHDIRHIEIRVAVRVSQAEGMPDFVGQQFVSGILPAMATVLVMTLLWTGCDALRIHNGSGHPVGLLVDAQGSNGTVNDHSVVTTRAEIGFSNYRAAPSSNEIIGFTNDRPAKYLATAWTPQRDTFDLTFQPLITIPVTVWIVKGPFEQQRLHAIEACIRTSAIWHAERMGVEFGSFEVRDATNDPQAAAHYAFPNGDVGDSVWKPLRDDIGFVAGRLNI